MSVTPCLCLCSDVYRTKKQLANFQEIDVFVLIACPENSLLEHGDFYKPVVTPFEMEVACNRGREWSEDYVTDFRNLLPGLPGALC